MSMLDQDTARAILKLHPMCSACGWRKGGADSWNGKACKCGRWEPPLVRDASKEHPSDFDQPPTMRCAKCREVFERPFSEFFFRDRNGPCGWRKWCKACYSEAHFEAEPSNCDIGDAQRRVERHPEGVRSNAGFGVHGG